MLWAACVTVGVVGVGGVGGAWGCEAKRDPSWALTADEGAELIRDIRAERTRLSDLTPAERQYLLQQLKR